MLDLTTNRRLTRAFIAVRPVQLVLTPYARQRTSSGGFDLVKQPNRVPQTMTIIESSGVGGLPRPTATLDGAERRVEFQLLGYHDAIIAVRDRFTHQDKEWEVVEVFYDNEYERRALVSARG